MADHYIREGSISICALAQLFDDFREAGVSCHTFEIHEGNRLLARIAPDPYCCSDKRENYSLSKIIVSTAIGMAVYEGKLSLNQTIVDLFPDKVPPHENTYLREMTIRHLLTMTTGHTDCSFHAVSASDDPVKTFLAQPVLYKPGTRFQYNTATSCLLGIILQKLTGLNPLDYLAMKFFPLAGIRDVYWNQTANGATEGGVGFHASCDDIAQFGILYANGGVYAGKRLLSEEWVREAGSPQINILNDGSPATHENGYSYQFWMKREDGFSGEGAYGQYCIVFPSRKLSIAMQMESQGHDPIPAVYRFIDHLHDKDTEILPKVVPIAYPPLYSEEENFPNNGNIYMADPNPMGITLFSFSMGSDNTLCFNYSDGRQFYTITAGNNRWIPNKWFGKHMMPKLNIMHNDFPEVLQAGASYRIKDNQPEILLRLTNAPHTIRICSSFPNSGSECQLSLEPSLNRGLTVAESVIRGVYLHHPEKSATTAECSDTATHQADIVNLKA